MALASLRHSATAAGRFLPGGTALFFRHRAMEIVGLATAAIGVASLVALITYHSTDPSLNRATGFAPRNLFGVPGATFADVMMQSLGLGSLLVPVALSAWGIMLMRRHALPFFGLRLALLLLATLLASSAASALDAIGHWTPHAGPGGVTGAAVASRFKELTLTYSDGWLLDFLPPITAIAAVLLMVPAIGMKRGHLPVAMRLLLLPFSLLKMLLRAGVAVWRGRPEREMPAEAEAPQPTIGYADVPGEIDASQYDPARFTGIPEHGQPLPGRDTLMVDAPLSPIADLKPVEAIPDAPPSLDIPPMAPRAAAKRSSLPPLSSLLARVFGRERGTAHVDVSRVEPVFGQPAAAAPPPGESPAPVPAAAPVAPPAQTPVPAAAAASATSARILHLPRRPGAPAETPP
ncbi:DNA translocase FtsK 4TM domain-containing protein, partial [Reyranella sp. CPCC 100927]|uniref:DNA translocase FtsK 4TM domain-containing protein n=1 Tax=Reyranella sp. CPCC 100927 TaxID=2599616 RepID=UPI0011B87C30